MTTNESVKHAEYKIPGGKLLVIDLELEQDKLKNVQLSGDFFMEPPDALYVINDTLEGLPANTSDEQIIRAINNNLGPDVQLYGITIEGIAVVLKRALA